MRRRSAFCSISARSCVDLESQQAWLIADGKVVRGPVKISSGGPGRETPVGHSLRVYRKEKDHRSGEFRLANGQPAPMPWAVFFADGGIAFSVDQQPYVQGYMAVTSLWLNLTNGNDIGGGGPVLTGPSIVDSSNIDAIQPYTENNTR